MKRVVGSGIVLQKESTRDSPWRKKAVTTVKRLTLWMVGTLRMIQQCKAQIQPKQLVLKKLRDENTRLASKTVKCGK